MSFFDSSLCYGNPKGARTAYTPHHEVKAALPNIDHQCFGWPGAKALELNQMMAKFLEPLTPRLPMSSENREASQDSGEILADAFQGQNTHVTGINDAVED